MRLLCSRRMNTFKLYFCSYKHVLEGFTLFERDDRRIFKDCFQQRLILYKAPMFDTFCKELLLKYEGWKYGHTHRLDFCQRFPRCTDELLKRVTKNPFNYFTNPNASYYLQPTMKDVLNQFSELAKLPKPGEGCLSPKQIAELRRWTSVHAKIVRQNTTRNFSTKDKLGTLPLNVYEASPPKEKTVDFNALLQDASTNQNNERENSRKERNVLYPQGTYVLYPQSCRSRSLQNKLLLHCETS